MLIKIKDSWVESSIVDVVTPGAANSGEYRIECDGYDRPLAVGCTPEEIDAFVRSVNEAEGIRLDACDDDFDCECGPHDCGCVEDFEFDGVAGSFPRLTGVDVPIDSEGDW